MEYFKENVEVVIDQMFDMLDSRLISSAAFKSIFCGLVDTREGLLDDDYIMDYIYKIEQQNKSNEQMNDDKIEGYLDLLNCK
jgi:hypothetical protein